MSVAQLTARELGTFAAIATHLKLTDLPTACQLAERIAAGNRRAFEAQYGEFVDPVSADDVEREALPLLASPAEMVDRHFGPLAYNMIANDGTTFDQDGETTQDLLMSLDLRAIEEACYRWQEGQQREKRRREENDEAFIDVAPLEKLSGDEITRRCAAAKCNRIIYAEFRVDQSDPYTDYHGGRTVRTICLGFGKGKRENFKQLRKAAGQFPPTADFGPGKGVFRPRVVFANDITGNGNCHWKGSFSHWHNDLTGPMHDSVEFTTREEAEAYIAEKGEPHPVSCDGEEARFEWKICEEDIENRENYSMGGGNYLGRSRYSGWQVSSRPVEWGCSDMEFFEPPRRTARPKAPAQTPDRSAGDPISHSENSSNPAGVDVMRAAGAVAESPPVACEVQKHHHTKKGVDFWLVVLSDRVERDQFETLRDAAKIAGGWYSRKWGTTPGGFGFEIESEAEAFAAMIREGGASETPEHSEPAPISHSENSRKPERPPADLRNEKLAEKFTQYAERLEADVELLRAPRLENTPKRQGQASAARCKAQDAENAAKALRALADGWASGDVPELCRGFTSRKSVCEATEEGHNRVQVGFYDVFSPSGEFRDDSDEAKALRAFCGLEGMTPEREKAAERERLVTGLRNADIPGFFPTPDELADRVIVEADIGPDMWVLEPSAGMGDLAGRARDAGANVVCGEQNHSLCELLRVDGHNVRTGDFLNEFDADDFGTFDRVIMNPPFEKGADVDHVRHAFQMLKEGGRLVAIMSAGSFFRTGSKDAQFREWLDGIGGTSEQLPEGSFKSAFRSTGVSTYLVTIDKPETPDRSEVAAISHGENSRSPAEPVASAVDYADWL